LCGDRVLTRARSIAAIIKFLIVGLEKQRRNRAHSQANDSYLSSGHRYYDVSVPTLRTLAKAWLKTNGDIPDAEFLAVLDRLYRGKSYEEKVLASILLSYHRTRPNTIAPKASRWLARPSCRMGGDRFALRMHVDSGETEFHQRRNPD